MTDETVGPTDPSEDDDIVETQPAEELVDLKPVLGDETEQDAADGEDVKTSELPADAF